jgi:hypothetical protein
MNARQRLNEMLQLRHQPAAQFTYDKSGTDHFPTFVAHLQIGDREYVGESRGTKKLAAESCAAKVFEDTATARALVDCRLPNWRELASAHGNVTYVAEARWNDYDDIIAGPCIDAMLIGSIHDIIRFSYAYDEDEQEREYNPLVVYTGSKMVRDYILAMNSGKIKGLGPFTIPVMLGDV